ncbi:MAG: hypothetical protein ABFD54_11465 [Armatimonadota bacterium]
MSDIPAMIIDENVAATSRGIVGTRVYYCLWEDLVDDNNLPAGLPVQGDAWDSYNPYLRCDNITNARDDAFGARVTCNYSTQGEFGENFYERGMEISTEVLNVARSRKWQSTETAVDIPVSIILPCAEYTITIRQATTPIESIFSALGKVNSAIFHGAPIEHLLFTGASIRESYDRNGVLMYCQCSYKFLRRTRSHNVAWREAVQKVRKDGTPIFWHDDSEWQDDDYYTTDGSKIGQPVYVDGDAGTAGWDKPIYIDTDGITTRYLYDSCNFETVLGLPA